MSWSTGIVKMSDKSANLKLPFIQSAQAQKHVTHNDAITNLDILTQLTVEDKDLSTPPPSPIEGTCYIIASAATAEWAGKENQLAAWQDSAWRFYEPAEGWVAWIRDEDTQAVFDGALWNELTASGGGGGTNLNPVTGDLLGVNATADTTNKFSVNSDASLFNHNGSDHQLKINKNANADNASVVFQTAFSGRAEFGLTGDDDFHMKVSPDGTTFHEGIVIDKDTGEVSFPNTTFSGGGTAVNSVFGRTGSVIAEANDYSFDQISGVSDNVLIGRLTSGTGAQEALSAAQVRSFLNIEDNATGDQTGSEIKTVLFAEEDTNNFDDAQQSKLASIETGATADLTGAEIKALYEAEVNTNAFDDAAVSKLTGIEMSADVTDEANVISALDGSALTNVSVSSSDKVIVQDVSDADNIKTVTAQSIADLAAGGSGDVTGPASSSNFRIAMFDGATGKLIKELDAGTSGQFLKSQGSGTTPVWDNISGGGDLLSTNNLADISNAETARTNLGLEIGVDVAAAGSTSLGVSSDLLMMALRVADLEGDGLGLVDGIADPFDDETDIDTVNSSNQTFMNDKYVNNLPAANIMPTMTGGTTSGVTVSQSSYHASHSGYIGWRAFDRIEADATINKAWLTNGAAPQQLSIDFETAHDVSGYTIQATTEHLAHSPNAFTFEGSTDNSTWVVLDTQTSQSWTALETKVFLLSSTANYRYYRLNVSAAGSTKVAISEMELLGTASATNMTVISDPFTADSAPSSARLMFFVKPVDSITINTDVVGAVSRDNGTTYTNATLVEVIEYSDGTKVYEAENVDISGQPSGISMRWKLTTANLKSVEFSAALLQWS